MLHLRTPVLGPFGTVAPLGKWLLPSEAPFMTTVDATGTPVRIIATAPVNYDDLQEPMFGIEVDGAEKVPLLATAGTRVWSLDKGMFTRVDHLHVGEALRVPVPSPYGPTVSWARVKRIASGVLTDRLWPGTPHLCGTLRLAKGAHSWGSPSAFIHSDFDDCLDRRERIPGAREGRR